MIYKNLTFEEFKHEFWVIGREDSFPNMLRELYDYLNELGGLELDVIAVCRDYEEISHAGFMEYYAETGEEFEEAVDRFGQVIAYNGQFLLL